ncbi:MAG: ADP-ribosylation factor-like protein [Gemmatimonadota bacterium]|jgi:signal recognition particle receptor subunit beta
MPLVNYTTREITCKIVFYGPGRSGKTTNLQYIHGVLPQDRKGEMVSLATETDRTLFFDFLPLDLGNISGFRTRLQLYTVPGQVYYNVTRKLVLRGADGVVFVADSASDRMDANVESMRNLQENLLEHGFDVREMPTVLQYNKRDLADATPVPQMEETLNFRDVPSHQSVATRGEGVFATLRTISELVLRSVSQRFGAAPGPAGDGV